MNAVTKPNPGRELTAIQLQPALLECERKSLLLACLRAANDGLMPDGREGAFVIFKSKKGPPTAQWMPMYAGLLKKVRNTGELLSISANVVYERDQFDYELGDQERIVHKPAIGDRGKPIAAYAIAHLKGGGIEREVMDANAIRQVQAVSRASAEESPWNQWPDEMARKTVIRRLYKRLPSSTEMDKYLKATPVVERELAPQLADTLKHAQLPDPASYETRLFHQAVDARLAMDEATDAESVDRIYYAAVKQFEQLEADVPEDLTKARLEKLATLTQ
jgi:phage RecT family recombinase